MTPKDRIILDHLTEHLNKMRGISTPPNEPDKLPENSAGEVIQKIKSIPLGIYVNTDRDNEPGGK